MVLQLLYVDFLVTIPREEIREKQKKIYKFNML